MEMACNSRATIGKRYRAHRQAIRAAYRSRSRHRYRYRAHRHSLHKYRTYRQEEQSIDVGHIDRQSCRYTMNRRWIDRQINHLMTSSTLVLVDKAWPIRQTHTDVIRTAWSAGHNKVKGQRSSRVCMGSRVIQSSIRSHREVVRRSYVDLIIRVMESICYMDSM